MNRIADLKQGDLLEAIKLNPVTRIDLIKYAGSSGDFNPIHTIDNEAKRAGLPGIIAHGMWTMGNLAKLFTPYYEDGFIQDYQIRFVGMVFLSDVLTLKAKVSTTTDSYTDFQVHAVNQNDKDVIIGNIRFSKF